MALSEVLPIFGIDTMTLISSVTKVPSQIFRVTGSASVNFTGDQVPLTGGSLNGVWAMESGQVNTEVTVNLKEYPAGLWEYMAGADVTTTTAETAGNISAMTNSKGTSVFSATTGVATVALDSDTPQTTANYKFGRYYIVCTAAATVDILCDSNIDFDTGTDAIFQGDDLSIVASDLTIATTTDVAIPSFGLMLTGGSGTIGMTVGDVAYFDIRPINVETNVADFGKATSTFSEFEVMLYSQKRANGDMFKIWLPKVVPAGLPINLTEKDWSTTDINMTGIHDSALDLTFRVTQIRKNS